MLHLHRKKQNFVQGAFILLVANLIVKVIGALFQIPLTRMVGVANMGLFNTAYTIYMVMLVVSSVGLPSSLAKMVAEATALGREREVRRIVRVAACIFVPFGAVCTLLLFFGAGVLAERVGNPGAAAAVAAISPSVLMVSTLSVFRGYYQGRSDMVPTAVSQIIEALGKLLLGLGFAVVALGRGADGPAIAAAIVLGITIGEVVAVLYMLARSAFSQRRAQAVHALNDSMRPASSLCKSLLALTIPITINSAVMSVTDLIDLALIMNRLQDIGMSEHLANINFGAYKTMAINFFNLPQTLVTAIAVSALPAIAGANASQNFTKVKNTMGTTFRLTMLITLPAGAGFLLLAQPILRLVYSEHTALAGPLMQILGLAVPCVAVVAITNAILQALGRADLPLISMFAGAVVKLFMDYALLGTPEVNIAGAPISTTVCYALIAAINLFQISRLTHALPSFGKTLVRPFAATVGMGAATVISFQTLTHVLSAAPGSAMDKVATLISICVAVAVYAVLLLALRAVEREDILMMPGGEKLADLLHLK